MVDRLLAQKAVEDTQLRRVAFEMLCPSLPLRDIEILLATARPIKHIMSSMEEALEMSLPILSESAEMQLNYLISLKNRSSGSGLELWVAGFAFNPTPPQLRLECIEGVEFQNDDYLDYLIFKGRVGKIAAFRRFPV